MKTFALPKAIVFDLDGTLVDSGSQVMQAFRHALHPFGIEATYELLEKIRSRKQHNLFEGLIHDDHAPLALERLAQYSMQAVKQVTLYPGLDPILKLLSKRKIPMAVWTGRDSVSAAQILQHLDIHHHFDRLIGSCHVTQNKPHPEGLLMLVEHFGCDPQEILMIGDHEHDIHGARQAGCRSALALWNGRHPMIGEEHAPDHRFEATPDFHAFFYDLTS
jgi:HAD superfamily hydrolase (TIGR01509 family)